MKTYRIAIVGVGKIATARHIPVISAHPAFELVAVTSQDGTSVPGVERTYRSHLELLASPQEIDALALCTPPDVRHRIALDALAAGKHVLLEKPPTATMGELWDLSEAGRASSKALFATWHSRFNAAVETARTALVGKNVARLSLVWNEDVDKYHPGQQWIWKAGGFGVFDAGINGLSILTWALPEPLFVCDATIFIPAGAETPIAADVTFSGRERGERRLRAQLDWRADVENRPVENRSIVVHTADGMALRMTNGGRRLEIDGKTVVDEPNQEYLKIYDRFHALIGAGQSDVDETPLRLVSDIFLKAHVVRCRDPRGETHERFGNGR